MVCNWKIRLQIWLLIWATVSVVVCHQLLLVYDFIVIQRFSSSDKYFFSCLIFFYLTPLQSVFPFLLFWFVIFFLIRVNIQESRKIYGFSFIKQNMPCINALYHNKILVIKTYIIDCIHYKTQTPTSTYVIYFYSASNSSSSSLLKFSLFCHQSKKKEEQIWGMFSRIRFRRSLEWLDI